MQQTKRPDKDAENWEPWPVGGRNAWQPKPPEATQRQITRDAVIQVWKAAGKLPRAVVTSKLDIYDIIFISLILAAGAASLCTS